MAAFQPTPEFNNRFQFPSAYGFDADDILGFLQTVAGDANIPANRRADFQLLYDDINALRVNPNGPKFLQPKPEQQFLRRGNLQPDNNFAVDPTRAIGWTVNTIQERYFIIFDLLGAFLSLMGPAPANATPKNYFLPLVVVYARWCSALARGVAVRPTVTQITWASNDNNQTWHYFLGSSSAGFNKKPANYKAIVGEARHGYLQHILRAPYLNYGQSPSRDPGVNGNAGTNFGNCAETYPFLYILGDPTLRNNSFGIAFDVSSATHAAYNGQDYWARGPMMPPCDPNCQRLLEWYGILNRLQHFQLWTT